MEYTVNKTINPYVEAVGRKMYERTPKAVYAALAYSLALRLTGTDNHEEAIALLGKEWEALHNGGIVPQKPAKEA